MLYEKYFLGDIGKNKRKIAYAPSFGMTEIMPIYTNKIKKWVNRLDYVSVREKSGQIILDKLGITSVMRVIDPTFLVDKIEYKEMMKKPDAMKCDEDYILVYIMQKEKKIYHYTRTIKEKKKLKVIEISRYGFNPGIVDETLVDVGPCEFLYLVNNASYVITNSYHGLIFSMIFGKRACIIPSRQYTTRIIDLLELYKIKDRDKIKDKGYIIVDFDTEKIALKIKREKEAGLRYLMDAINGQ